MITAPWGWGVEGVVLGVEDHLVLTLPTSITSATGSLKRESGAVCPFCRRRDSIPCTYTRQPLACRGDTSEGAQCWRVQFGMGQAGEKARLTGNSVTVGFCFSFLSFFLPHCVNMPLGC